MWGRDKIASTAKEIADYLQVVENIKALQIGQKDLADAYARWANGCDRSKSSFAR